MSAPVRKSVPSRELAGYLGALSLTLAAVQAQHYLLGVESIDQDTTPEKLTELSRWLYDAKFTVEDPFRFKLVCEEIRKVWKEGPDSCEANLENFRRLARMAEAALNDQSMLEFIK